MATIHPMFRPASPPRPAGLRSIHAVGSGEVTPFQDIRWQTLALLLLLLTCVTAADGVRVAWLAVASALHRVAVRP
jgi:hypothetical protein